MRRGCFISPQRRSVKAHFYQYVSADSERSQLVRLSLCANLIKHYAHGGHPIIYQGISVSFYLFYVLAVQMTISCHRDVKPPVTLSLSLSVLSRYLSLSLHTYLCPTGRRTLVPYTPIVDWSVVRSNGPSCLLNQSPRP